MGAPSSGASSPGSPARGTSQADNNQILQDGMTSAAAAAAALVTQPPGKY